MTAYKLGLFALFALLLAVGQILFKYSASTLSYQHGISALLALPRNTFFLLGVLLYSVSTILWVWLLKDIELGKAYPFAALAFIIVPILSHFTLGEGLTFKMIMGSILIFSGVIVSQL